MEYFGLKYVQYNEYSISTVAKDVWDFSASASVATMLRPSPMLLQLWVNK